MNGNGRERCDLTENMPTTPNGEGVFEVIAAAFGNYHLKDITEFCLLRVCADNGCPSEQIAQTHLNRMVELGLLQRRTDEQGLVLYSCPNRIAATMRILFR